jgi:putative ABC transport system substrate-binding protein
VAWPLAVAAPQSTSSQRLAIFSPSQPSADLHEHSGSKVSPALFFAELRRLGHIEGQNLKVERYGREQNTSGPEPWRRKSFGAIRMSSLSLALAHSSSKS